MEEEENGDWDGRGKREGKEGEGELAYRNVNF